MRTSTIACLVLILFQTNAFALRNSDTSFVESPITLHTYTGSILGTITVPQSFTKGPVVLIIAGSGPTDRNGNNPMMKNNSLLQMAHSLAQAGIASLRFDKRGIAGSQSAMIKEEDLRFEDYVMDAANWIRLLRKDNRFTQVIVAGHSEGSLIGMLAAKGLADKYISISGAGKSASNLIREQLSPQPPQIKDIAFPILDSLERGLTVQNVNLLLYSLFRPSVQPYLISWFKYDPSVEIQKLPIPTLILQGDNDIQVSVQDAQLLAAAKSNAEFVVIKKMNHILKIVSDNKNDNIESYNDITIPISTDMMDAMIRFIRK
jgi:pimeloyl-ACP methyl ester carboxylesterase